MKNRMNKGFTLIELLIVIAIIGILAAVLIPQLLGARVSANKKAVQAHSANVYKVLQAALADDSAATVTSIVTLSGATCRPAKTVGAFSWTKAPGTVAADADCSIAANGNDFLVTVKGDAASANYQSINGAN